LGGVGGLELLLGVSHEVSSATTLDELATSTAHWARSATGCDPTHVILTLPDAAGRLRVAWEGGTGTNGYGKRSVTRRTAFRTKSAVRIEADEGRELAMFPLVSRGSSFGVLEIAAPREAVEESWADLEAIADQVAIALNNLRERRRLRSQIESLEAVTTLGRDLVRAQDPGTALELAAGFIAERLGLIVAAWIATANSGRMVLTTARGMRSPRRTTLHDTMAVVPTWSSSRTSEREDVVRRFGDVMGTRRVAIIDAGDGLLLVADAPDSLRPTLDAVGSLLAGTLPLLATTARAQQLDEQLDMGIALTAHELRAPLVGVKAALEVVLQTDAESALSLGMLRRSLLELEEFVEMTDSLVLWAVGDHLPERRPVDVVKVVQKAVGTCELAWGSGRVVVSSPSRVMARIDHFQLRRAIENVLRNALACSGPDSKVTVSVSEHDGLVTVSVSDTGPGISEAEWGAIFDPLTRGRVPSSRSGAHGLGLFIVRRVIDAHGGRIWVDSDRTGTTFHLQVPIELASARRTAS
jgi:signal transduction histidine kinase